MRLWSIHPSYLDAKGIVALWREGLLARAVLHGQTKGYTNHPQLARFKATKDPHAAIDAYLEHVANEAKARGYNFDTTKIEIGKKTPKLQVTDKQVAYEVSHLKNKLAVRDPERLTRHEQEEKTGARVRMHPIFSEVSGDIEPWEKV